MLDSNSQPQVYDLDALPLNWPGAPGIVFSGGGFVIFYFSEYLSFLLKTTL